MEKKITGADYLYLSLYAFAGIGLELVLIGVIESLSGAAVGILTAFGGFLYGSAYLIAGKDYRKALPLMSLMFVL